MSEQKKKRRLYKCCVIGCQTTSQNAEYKLFSFPRSKQKREEWLVHVNRKMYVDSNERYRPSAHSRVCSLHFKDGVREGLPLLQLGYDRPLTPTACGLIYDASIIPEGGRNVDVPIVPTFLSDHRYYRAAAPAEPAVPGPAPPPAAEPTPDRSSHPEQPTVSVSEPAPVPPAADSVPDSGAEPGVSTFEPEDSEDGHFPQTLRRSPRHLPRTPKLGKQHQAFGQSRDGNFPLPSRRSPRNLPRSPKQEAQQGSLRQTLLKNRASKRVLDLGSPKPGPDTAKRARFETDDLMSDSPRKNGSTTESESDALSNAPLPNITPQGKRDPSYHGKTLMNVLNDLQRLREERDYLVNLVNRSRSREERKLRKLLSPLSTLTTDAKVALYTGLPNRGTFEAIFKVLESNAKKIRYWRGSKTAVGQHQTYKKTVRKAKQTLIGSPLKQNAKSTPPSKERVVDRTPRKGIFQVYQKKLTLKEEFLMTLMRIRRGFPELDLAVRFNVAQSIVSQTLVTWIKFLAKELRCLVFMPSREMVQKNLPDAFRKQLKKVKHIVDCAETYIERPTDPVLQYVTWSQYKHHNTAKYFVCITPDGFISFVSQIYPGRITDKQIVDACGWLDLLEEDDEVMADRGFLIREELLEQLVRLRAPKGLRGVDQLSREDLSQVKGVAHARIHVERAIRRIKTFRILGREVNLRTVPQLDDILVIASALSNMNGPLIAGDEDD